MDEGSLAPHPNTLWALSLQAVPTSRDAQRTEGGGDLSESRLNGSQKPRFLERGSVRNASAEIGETLCIHPSSEQVKNHPPIGLLTTVL